MKFIEVSTGLEAYNTPLLINPEHLVWARPHWFDDNATVVRLAGDQDTIEIKLKYSKFLDLVRRVSRPNLSLLSNSRQ